MLTPEVVNMGQTRRAFTREFKQEVAGDPLAAFPGKGRRKPHEEELARLKRDLARVTQERDFLKSVGAYFAKPSS